MLVASVAGNDLERARFCLDWGVDVDQRVTHSYDHLGSTPLSVAVRQQNLEMVDLLLSFGANPKFDGRGQSLFPLTQSWEIRDRLLAAGETIDSEWSGESFLEHAIMYSRQMDTNESDTERRWKEVQEFLSRGATITDEVRKAALIDLELARRIENHLLTKGHRDTETRWILFRALLLGQKEVALNLLDKDPKLSEFPQSSDLQLAVRCVDSVVLDEWLRRIEASHRFRTSFTVELIEKAVFTAERQGNQEVLDLLTASVTRMKESQLAPRE
jgi:ankyrin repeat protein